MKALLLALAGSIRTLTAYGALSIILLLSVSRPRGACDHGGV
ncbi:hypothetical protein [Spiribacter pallidus]